MQKGQVLESETCPFEMQNLSLNIKITLIDNLL